jgi:tetratricopeptide (TPR) repeat protein
LQIAMLHSSASNHLAARDAYEKILQINPRHGPALNNLAYLYSEQLGNRERAYELGSKARELMSNDPFTADTFGWILYHRGDYPRALALIQECVRQMPQQPEVLFHLGMTHYMMGEETAARLALQNAVQLGEPDAIWRPQAAERLRILEIDAATANPAAVQELEQLAKSKPGDPILLSRLAAVAERNGDWERAAKGYEKALQSNTNLVPVMVKLAQLYATQLRNPQQAFTLARRARSLEPNDPRIAHTLGRLALDAAQTAADFQWAYGLLQEGARGQPDNPDAQWDFARAAYALGQVDTAQTTAQRVLALQPAASLAATVREFAEWIVLPSRPQEITAAASRITTRLQQRPDDVPALLANARLLEQQGNFKGAREAYERVFQRYPLFTPAHKPLALLLSDRLNEQAAAYEQATKARTAFPNDPEVARLLGRLAYQRGEFSRAAQLLLECAPAFPADGELFHLLGIAQFRMKQKESKATLTKALSLAPDSPLAPEARRLLAELK